ncbi:hypothetical protein JCM11641_003289 [Rhodosporidiobolus odoratus]
MERSTHARISLQCTLTRATPPAMSAEPSSSRLPPPIPYTNGTNSPGASNAATPRLSTSSASSVPPPPTPPPTGPPPPPPSPKPTFRVAQSPLMQPVLTPTASPVLSAASVPSSSPIATVDPGSAGMTPSRSWTRIIPQQPFVNGRGNVQLPGAARQFVPSASKSPVAGGSVPPSLSGSPTLNGAGRGRSTSLSSSTNGSPVPTFQAGTPHLGATSTSPPLVPVQKEGQQAYVRRDPSPGPSSALGAAQREQAEMSFLPSQFGVRQRVAIKTSSRPAAPRASSGSRSDSFNNGGMGRRGSTASGTSAASPVLGPGPSAPLPPLPSAQDRAEGVEGKGKGTLYPSPPPPLVSQVPLAPPPAPASTAGSTAASFYTASPALSSQSLSHASSSSSSSHPSLAPRSTSLTPSMSPSTSSSSSSSTPGQAAPAPISPASTMTPTDRPLSSTTMTSVLNKPRPRTPDPSGSSASLSLSSAGRRDDVATSWASRGGIPSSSTPAASPSPSSSARSPASINSHSVLNRPRPKTPDPYSSLSPSSSIETSPTLSRSTPASFSSAPSSAAVRKESTSVLDRGRPKTPDAGSVFRFDLGGASSPPTHNMGEAEGSVFRFDPQAAERRSVLDRSRPKTPDAGEMFQFAVPPLSYEPSSAPPANEAHKNVAEEEGEYRKPSVSVMDRPRPRTPDPQGWLDSVGGSGGSNATIKGSTNFSGSGGGGSTGTSPIVDRQMYGAAVGAGGKSSFSSSASGKGGRQAKVGGSGSFDSLASRTVSSSANQSSLRPSFDSAVPSPSVYSTSNTDTGGMSQHERNQSSLLFSSSAGSTLGNGSPARRTNAIPSAATSHYSTHSPSSRSNHSFSASTSSPSPSSSSLSFSPGRSSQYAAAAKPPFIAPLDTPTPTLQLDFDFDFGGSPFGSGGLELGSGSMFGLSDMLKGGQKGLGVPGSDSWIEEDEGAITPRATEESKGASYSFPPASTSTSTSTPTTGSAPMLPTASASSSIASFSTSHSRAPSQSGYLSAGPAHPSANGRSTPRKEPPKVDLKLELELEMERAIPVHRGILAEDGQGDEGDRVKRMRRDGEEDGAAARRRKGSREPQGSISSLASLGGSIAGTGTGSISDASVLSASLNGGSVKLQKRRRRRSLASLLSIGGSSLLGKEDKKEKEEQREREREKGRSTTPEPGMRSYIPEPLAFHRSSPEPQQPQRPPTLGAFAPRLSLDKSLPPTPHPRSASPASAIVADEDRPSEATAKRTSGALGRQFSRLRNRSTPSAGPSASSSARGHGHNGSGSGSAHGHSPVQNPRQPAFQVISATTTKKRTGGGSISSLGTNETHGSSMMGGSRRQSYEWGALPTASTSTAAPPPASSKPFTSLAPASQSVNAPSASPPLPFGSSTSSTAPNTALPFGRRLKERFTKTSGSRAASQSQSLAAADSWTAPVKDHSSATAAAGAPHGPPRPGRRRSSLSSLLGVGGSSASADGHGGPSSSSQSKKILGMSLPAGRKSEDFLTSGRGLGRGREQEMRRDWDEGPVQPPPIGTGRRSFDLLTERQTVPRRPSTDDLLTLAAAKLSKLTLPDDPVPPATPSTFAPPLSATTSTFDSIGTSSSHASGRSTPSDEVAGKAAAVVAHAALINRSDAGASNPIPAPTGTSDLDMPLYGSRTAAPVLVRSDSLRSGPPRASPAVEVAPPPALPTGPAPASAEAAAQKPREVQREAQSVTSAAWRKQRGKVPDSGVGSDASMTGAWIELEDALAEYTVAVRDNRPDRGPILSNTLLPFLRKEEDNPAPRVNEVLAQRQRDILFGWLSTLTTELKEMQPSHRGACLEGVAGIAESHFLSASSLGEDPAGQARYRTSVVKVLDFAVEKLNDKAVYANTLVFSGRVFALAFFRIEGVALKLLRALPPVKRHGLIRILEEAGVKENNLPPADLEAFPSHLWPLCLRDFQTYTKLLLPLKTTSASEDEHYLVRDCEVAVEMTGNWLIRWTASDSDLPFAFYRAYHRQLAAHLVPFEARENIVGQAPLPPSAIVTAPGFCFLAASLLDKSDSLVHRNLRSVTSIGPNSGNFNTNDSANLSFGQKPKVLELAHRRLVATMLDIIGGPPAGTGADASPDADARRFTFSEILPVWLRATAKRTSLWDIRGVYILEDLLEGVIYPLAYPTLGAEEEGGRVNESCLTLVDVPFIFHLVKLILLQADSTVTLMRTISLIYSHFEVFTLRARDRTELCEKIILDEKLFQRLFLHWNTGVRGYFIRLLVWRLSRLGVVAKEQNPNLPPDEGIIALFNLLNVRLEALRKRHDALEPLDNLTDEDSFFRPKRSTICSTRGVKEAPWTVDELAEPLDEESDDEEEEPQELVRSLPPPPASATSGMSGTSAKKGDLKTVAKVVSWLKGGLKNKSKTPKITPSLPDARIDPFTLERSATVKTPRRQDSTGSMAVEDDDFSTESGSQDNHFAPLPTTIETGLVPTEDSPGPHSAAAPVVPPGKAGLLSVKPVPFPSGKTPSRTKSTRSEKRASRSLSPAFFSFEFENGVVTRSDVDPTVASSAASVTSTTTANITDTTFPASPIRPRPDPGSAISPRVSLRFSKRISILPPAALDLLKGVNNGGVEAVPPIPAQYRQSLNTGYDKKLHPYAIRGLRDYEDALDEWTDWVARLQEEEDAGGKLTRTFVDVVPRLAVNWPLQQGED